MTAALADFTPAKPRAGKITDSRSLAALSLTPAPNSLKFLSDHKEDHQRIVGFALQSQGEISRGLIKWKSHGSDVLCLNFPITKQKQEGFGADSVKAVVLGRKDKKTANAPSPRVHTKFQLAAAIAQKLDSVY